MVLLNFMQFHVNLSVVLLLWRKKKVKKNMYCIYIIDMVVFY